jgi:hypothetical protein
MVLNVASTHKVHFATKPEERTVEKELKEIKHQKKRTHGNKAQETGNR